MFCEKCGTQLPDDSMFCEKCGNQVGREKKVEKKVEDNEVIFEVKPTYNFIYKMIPSIISVVIIFVIIFLPLMIVASTIVFIIAIGYIVISLIALFIKYIINSKQYERYDFDFYKTKIIYKDGFLNVSEKEVKYKYIREVTMRQSFIQRWFNLGTIILNTNAETGMYNGINIVDLENVNEKYRKIKEIIEI